MPQLSQRLESASRLRDGDLEDVPFATLLTAIAATERSAVIAFHRTPFEKQVILENGVPVDCRSNLAHETFGRFLVAENKLSEEDFASTLNETATRGQPHGEILIDRGLISPSELFRMLQQNLARKLLDLFTWRSGTFQIAYETPPVESPLMVRVPQLVLTGIAKFADQNEIDCAMNPLIGRTLARHPAPPFPEDDLRLGSGHKAVLAAVGSGKRIDEIAESVDIPFDELGRILYALTTLDLILPTDELKQIEPVTPAPRPAEEKAPATTPPEPVPATSREPGPIGAREAVAVENRMMQLYLSFRKQDAFDLLDLEEDSTVDAIDRSWLAYAETWAPWKFSLPPLMKLQEKAQELFNAGARAYAVLSDPEQRTTLITRRRTLREEAARAPSRDRFRIKTDLLDSEQQFRKGKALLNAGRYQEAISFLEFAADCDHQSGLYRAELAYCRFLQSPMIVTGSQSIEELSEAMRVDPECGLSWYYAGLIQKQLGRLDEAEQYLRTASRKMAPDRRPIEELKNLRG